MYHGCIDIHGIHVFRHIMARVSNTLKYMLVYVFASAQGTRTPRVQLSCNMSTPPILSLTYSPWPAPATRPWPTLATRPQASPATRPWPTLATRPQASPATRPWPTLATGQATTDHTPTTTTAGQAGEANRQDAEPSKGQLVCLSNPCLLFHQCIVHNSQFHK